MIVWRNLVLYDGECGLCDRLVQWLLRHDRDGILSYAALQGETAKPYVTGDMDTMVFVERGDGGSTRVFERSRGVFRILQKLGGIWRAVAWLRSRSGSRGASSRPVVAAASAPTLSSSEP